MAIVAKTTCVKRRLVLLDEKVFSSICWGIVKITGSTWRFWFRKIKRTDRIPRTPPNVPKNQSAVLGNFSGNKTCPNSTDAAITEVTITATNDPFRLNDSNLFIKANSEKKPSGKKVEPTSQITEAWTPTWLTHRR